MNPPANCTLAEDWFRRTALGDLLDVPEAKLNDDRLYSVLDQLLPHKERRETHVKERLRTLFGLEYDLLLYDVTSTYFEGAAAANPQAQHGYARDHRPDCKHVCIGLVVSREGYPLGYEVFAGNKSTDVVAPTTAGRTLRLRCVVRPDKAQTILLQHLGLTLPKRLRLPRGVARM